MDKAFWNNHYREDKTPWDMGEASPALIDYIVQYSHKSSSILIPGCGNAHEAESLHDMGFTDITLIDISDIVVDALQKKLAAAGKESIKVFCEDFFDHSGRYDLILEQTFFCALLPTQREAYVEKMYGLLKPGGKLAGVLFNRSFEAGPPFGGSDTEYDKLFSKKFKLRILEACYNSIKPRQGTELFVLAEK